MASFRVVEPMLAVPTTQLPVSMEMWVTEFKWDGVRVLPWLGQDGTWRLHTRRGHNIADRFAELEGLTHTMGPGSVLDGELVVISAEGRVDFSAVASRLQTHSKTATPGDKATFVAFDIPCLGGEDLRGQPWHVRRGHLESLQLNAPSWTTSIVGNDPEAMLAASLDHGMEGIVLKRRDSLYQAGRSRSWQKFKHEQHIDMVVGGWCHTRQGGISLLVGDFAGKDRLVYRGRVHQGVNQMPQLPQALEFLATDRSPFTDVVPKLAAQTHWLHPILTVEIAAGHHATGAGLRHPRLVRVRIDLL